MKPFKNKTILKILDYYKDIWSLNYAQSLAQWDLETYMPVRGVKLRGEALGRISTIKQKLFLDNEFVSLIKKAGGIQNLSDTERGVVRVLNKSLKFYQSLPKDFLEKYEKLVNTGTIIWREAKEKDDFSIFKKTLNQIFDANKKMAEYLGFKSSPYDALLDLFEEDLTSKDVDLFFGSIRNPLKLLLNKITSSEKYFKIHNLENTEYSKGEMVNLNEKVLKYLLNESGRFRQDTSTHPFTVSLGNTDTRITTWYHTKDFSRSLLATIHEFGHALYDLQCEDALEFTPISGGGSLVIHESQSRYWENFVGRNKLFIARFLPDMQKVVSKSLSLDDVYLYFNKVSPGFLRVEADEVTYHFHIMIRGEIERDILEGKLKFKDIKEVWNTKMKEYLGISPKKDSLGILQDIHWSGGSIGYFPTYSLGTFLSAQWQEKIGLETSKNVLKTKKELKNLIHKHGSTYTLQQLLLKNKMKFDTEVNIKYLSDKYSQIYDFKL